jgi:hypothetical protein
MNKIIVLASALGLAGAAFAQNFEIALVAPMTVERGETYTVEAWASVTGDQWVDGTSAFAGFGFDLVGSGNVATVTAATISDWAAGFGVEGTVDGINIVRISGGQLPNSGDLNPYMDASNPILLFTVDVTAADVHGSITYIPENPNPNGGLSFYPDTDEFYSIVAPNDPGTTLTLTGVTTRVVPAPATLALVGLAGLARRRRPATIGCTNGD